MTRNPVPVMMVKIYLASSESMIAALLLSAISIFTAKGNMPVKAAKSHKKAVTKKGW